MDRLEILCFAGTYALALAVELSRVVLRGSLRWYVGVGLMLLGWLVQTAYLGNLAYTSGNALPVTPFESVMALSWVVALIGLYLAARWPKQVAVGFFTLPVVLGLIAGAAWFIPRGPVPAGWRDATAFWGTIHGVFLLAGAVCACLAFAAGLMYMAQMRMLKSKSIKKHGFSLPSLEQSERVNRGAVTAAFPLLTAGLLIGMLLSAVELNRGASHGVPWNDPKVLSALGMWLVFAVLLHARTRPSMRGRAVMKLTFAAFAFLVFTWVGVEALRLPSAHGPIREARAGGEP